MARLSLLTVRDHEDQRAGYFREGTALRRVLLEAPFLARCSADKSAAAVRPREYAIRFPYMQVNRPGMVSWLIFDLDHQDAGRWEDEGLPAPNLVVRNPANGHAHLFYAIPPVCRTAKARGAPIAYMKAVYSAMATRLGADPDYSGGPVAKTPGHPAWETLEFHPHVYELGELADHVPMPQATRGKGARLEEVAHSRHCILFELLRHYAYSTVNGERERGTLDTFSRLLEVKAAELNSFGRHGFTEDLPLSSLKATVKSIARWTWERYTGSGGCNRGVMQLDKAMPLQERQRLAAVRTHRVRHMATAERLRGLGRALLQKGEAITVAALARASGLSRQAVGAYRHLLDELTTPAPAPAVPSLVPEAVKFAVHQVAAVLSSASRRLRASAVSRDSQQVAFDFDGVRPQGDSS